LRQRRQEPAIHTWLLDSLRNEVVDEHADEAVCTGEDEWWSSDDSTASVYSRNYTLRGGFLVTSRAVDLPREIETLMKKEKSIADAIKDNPCGDLHGCAWFPELLMTVVSSQV
jgi:hypothetical protein